MYAKVLSSAMAQRREISENLKYVSAFWAWGRSGHLKKVCLLPFFIHQRLPDTRWVSGF